MQYRKLGRSGLRVSEVAIGGWLTHGRSIGDEVTQAIVRQAFDLGINFFDTADVYNAGKAELALGVAIRDLRREHLVIATKCFFPMSEEVNDRGLSRKHITESVHASLKRIGIDYIDLMQFHRFDPEVPSEEIVLAIDDLVRKGKVLYWGVSEWKAHEITNIVAVARENMAHRPISNQPVYNMLQRGIEDSILPESQRLGLGQVVFSPLAQGVLTGKYAPGSPPPEGSRGADERSNMFMKEHLREEVLHKVQKLGEFAAERRLTAAQLALGWCLRQPGVSSVIVGATSAAQVEANAAASGVALSADEWSAAEEILA